MQVKIISITWQLCSLLPHCSQCSVATAVFHCLSASPRDHTDVVSPDGDTDKCDIFWKRILYVVVVKHPLFFFFNSSRKNECHTHGFGHVLSANTLGVSSKKNDQTKPRFFAYVCVFSVATAPHSFSLSVCLGVCAPVLSSLNSPTSEPLLPNHRHFS